MIEALVPIIIIAIALIGVNKREYCDYLSIEQGNSLKGIAALLLVVVHIRERLIPMPIAYKVLASIGFYLVAVFFFYSGYGIVKKAINDPEYVKKFSRRELYLGYLIVVSELVYYSIHIIIFNREFKVFDMIKCITGVTMLNGAMWTVVAMLVIQLILHLGLYTKIKNFTLLSIIGIIIYIVFALLRGRGAWEMQSCIAFALGAFVAEHKGKFDLKIDNGKSIFKYIVVFLLSYLSPYIIRYFIDEDMLAIRVLFGSICSCAYILIILWVVKRVKIINVSTKYVGKMFTEVYLFHGIILDLCRFYYSSYFTSNNSTILSFVLILVVLVISALINGSKRIKFNGG